MMECISLSWNIVGGSVLHREMLCVFCVPCASKGELLKDLKRRAMILIH